MHDPIVDEVRKIRAEIFKKHGNDLTALVRYLRRRQKSLHRKAVKLPPKKNESAPGYSAP